jgi:dynein heavy chain
MLEDNQVLIQGMMANRYMDTFRDSILSWNKKLMAVADVVAIVGEIQVSTATMFCLVKEVERHQQHAGEESTVC